MDLSRVWWIGGPGDGPRSAVAEALAARFGAALVHAAADFRAVLAELRELESQSAVVEGDLEPKSVAAVLHRPEQALFVGDGGRDVAVLRLAALPANLPLDELVEAAVQRLSR